MLLASIGYPAARQAKPHFYAYGLGWFLQDYKGRLLAMHTGSLYGANAIVGASCPRNGSGWSIFVNADRCEYRHAFMYDVIDRFIGSRGKDWNADLLEAIRSSKPRRTRGAPRAIKARPANTSRPLPLPATPASTRIRSSGEDAGRCEAKTESSTLAMQADATFSLSHWSYDSFEASDDARARGALS